MLFTVPGNTCVQRGVIPKFFIQDNVRCVWTDDHSQHGDRRVFRYGDNIMSKSSKTSRHKIKPGNTNTTRSNLIVILNPIRLTVISLPMHCLALILPRPHKCVLNCLLYISLIK